MAASLPARTLARPSFTRAFSDAAFLRAMLRFESALARAQAAEGLMPTAHADAVASACDAFAPDFEAFVAEGKRSATLAVPLVRLLKDAVPKDVAAMSTSAPPARTCWTRRTRSASRLASTRQTGRSKPPYARSRCTRASTARHRWRDAR